LSRFARDPYDTEIADVWIDRVREALSLQGTKYPPGEERHGFLANGRRVRLLSSRRVRGLPRGQGLMRLQVECRCGKWIPAGRFWQHLSNGRIVEYGKCRIHSDCRQDREMSVACFWDRARRRGHG
jgi:hypothetical protein